MTINELREINQPTQVLFWDHTGDHYAGGILYGDVIICGCCGGIFDVDEIIEFADLGEFINLPVKNYSSGMLSKLGFSIATIVDPDILILDEVLGVGDINFRKKSKEKLNSLMESNTTVLLVSHSINEVRSICDKAIWIEKNLSFT